MTAEHEPRQPALAVDDLTVGYDAREVVAGASFAVEVGGVTAIIGPNGSGKSTLLRTIAGLARPQQGSVRVAGDAVHALPPRTLARMLTMLPQTAVAPEGLTVGDLVARGRQPHQRWYRQWSREDERVVADAMRMLNVTELADRPLDELSGGQRQRAWIAMCLAQETPLILLDEPTTHLDLAHAVEILETVHRLAHAGGRTVVMVLHDLGLAARYCDQIVVVSNGRIRGIGAPRDILTVDLIDDAFGLRAHVFDDPIDHEPVIVPARGVLARRADGGGTA